MVFGWGKKKQEEPESKEEFVSFAQIPNILQKIDNEKSQKLIQSAKFAKNNTQRLFDSLSNIVKSLEKDDLKVDEIDKILRVIVVRGKEQVISIMKKELSIPLQDIQSKDDSIQFNNDLKRRLKIIGDVLGRQTRVIHLFAKKYAGQLKEELEFLNSESANLDYAVKSFLDSQHLNEKINSEIKEIKNLQEIIIQKTKRISELQQSNSTIKKSLDELRQKIQSIKQTSSFKNYQSIKSEIDSLSPERLKIQESIQTQFTKISRPLDRYLRGSSLDKQSESFLQDILKDPYSILDEKNKDSIIQILENTRKGVVSGSLSVKDEERTSQQINETIEKLDEFISIKKQFEDKKRAKESEMNKFENYELLKLEEEVAIKSKDFDEQQTRLESIAKEQNQNQHEVSIMMQKIDDYLINISDKKYKLKQ